MAGQHKKSLEVDAPMDSQTHPVSRTSSTKIEMFPVPSGVRMILTNKLSSSSIHLTFDPDYARDLATALVKAVDSAEAE